MQRRLWGHGARAARSGFWKPALILLVAVLCPCTVSSNSNEVDSNLPELRPPTYLDEDAKDDDDVLDREVRHEVEAKVKTTQDICISMMLLGCMGFMMANFYLINWPDEDIKRISWEVISSTVSIFSAVLLFQACNKVIEYYILEDLWIWYQLLVDMVHMSFWFVILQLALAYYSGAISGHHEVDKHKLSLTSASESVTDFQKRIQRQHSAQQHMEAIEANVGCFAILLGHITGFAAINAWGTLQQAVPRDLLWCGLVPVVAFGGIYCIYQGTDKMRELHTLADEEEDEFEKLWDEEVAETEDDVMALAVSFLLVQVLRFCISGALPNTEGEDPEGMTHSTGECGLLLLAAFAFGCFEIIKITLRQALGYSSRCTEDGEEEERTSVWIRDITAMATAWCIHFSVDWYLTSNLVVEGAMSAVVCALAVTCLALGLIFVLDILADMDFTDDEVDNALRALIASLGILIGFSWERSFDAAVGGLAEQRAFGLPPPVITLLLALILASMVIPAWKWYILPTVLKHKKETHHHHHEQEGHDAEAPSHSTDLKQPLMGGKKEVSFQEDAEKADHASKGSQNGTEEKRLAELQATLAAKEQEIREAQKQNSDLQAACEKAHAGAKLHADRAAQLEGSVQEKDRALQEKASHTASLQAEGKRLASELDRLQKSAGDHAAMANKLQAASQQAQELEQQRDEEMVQVQSRIVDSEAEKQRLQQLLDKSLVQQKALQQENQDLQEEVRRLKQQVSPTKMLRPSPQLLTPGRTSAGIPGTAVATVLDQSTTSLPGAGGQVSVPQPYTPAPFAPPAFTRSAPGPPGSPGVSGTQPGARLISSPQSSVALQQPVPDRASYPQPTWPTTVSPNTQLPPGSRLV